MLLYQRTLIGSYLIIRTSSNYKTRSTIILISIALKAPKGG